MIFSENNLHSVDFRVLPSSYCWDSKEKTISYGCDHNLLRSRTKYVVRSLQWVTRNAHPLILHVIWGMPLKLTPNSDVDSV